MSGPYRTPGREVTEADRVEPVTRPMQPMVEQMIEAHREARLRSHGRRQWMLYRLSYAARRAHEAECIPPVELAAAIVLGPWTPPPADTPAPRGCEYIGTFCGFPVYADPEMIAGWTVEVGSL